MYLEARHICMHLCTTSKAVLRVSQEITVTSSTNGTLVNTIFYSFYNNQTQLQKGHNKRGEWITKILVQGKPFEILLWPKYILFLLKVWFKLTTSWSPSSISPHCLWDTSLMCFYSGYGYKQDLKLLPMTWFKCTFSYHTRWISEKDTPVYLEIAVW